MNIELVNVAGACLKTIRTGEATIEIADEVTIVGDRSRLQHGVENPFRTALEHGWPAVSARIGKIDDHGSYVDDTGSGIPEDAHEAVFDPGIPRQSTEPGLD